MTKSELQHKLDASLHRFDVKHDLFYGGCCFAAAEVAQKLEEVSVKYEVVIYHDWKTKEPAKLSHHIKNSSKFPAGIDHVAIVIKVPGKPMDKCEIGGNYYDDLYGDKYYKRCVLHTLTSEDLKKLYASGSWNGRYNTSNNKLLRRNIATIVKQYKKENNRCDIM